MRKQPSATSENGELSAWVFTELEAPPHCVEEKSRGQSDGFGAKRKQVYFPNGSLSDDEEVEEEGDKSMGSSVPADTKLSTEDVSMDDGSKYKVQVDVVSDNALFLSTVRQTMPELNVRNTLVSESNPNNQSIDNVPSEVAYLANRITEAVGSLALTDYPGRDKTRDKGKKRQFAAEHNRMFASTNMVETKSKRYKILFDLAIFVLHYESWTEQFFMTLHGKGLHCDEAHASALKADVVLQRRTTLGLMHDEIKDDANKTADLTMEVEIVKASFDSMLLHLPKQCADFYVTCLERHAHATELLKTDDVRSKAAVKGLASVFTVRGKDRTEKNVVSDWETLAKIYSRKRGDE
jgi:hypothetical protein